MKHACRKIRQYMHAAREQAIIGCVYGKRDEMKYVVFIGSDGLPVPEALAVMQRELPAWIEEMDGRGVRLLGRELDLPQTAVTVRVRGGETLVTDGPFAETKEFVAGFDIFECADLDEAIEAAAKSPVSRYHPMEIRPFAEGLRLGEAASAFAREDDSAGHPYLLTMWMGGTPAAPLDDEAVMREGEAWRQDLEARGLQVLGNALEGPDTATTIRVRDGQTLISDGPFIETRSSSPASTSSAALTGSRRSSSRSRIRSPGTTRSRCARSTANDHAGRSARGGCGLPRGVGPRRGHPDPADRRLGPGREVRAGGVHRGAAAMAGRQHPAAPRPPGTATPSGWLAYNPSNTQPLPWAIRAVYRTRLSWTLPLSWAFTSYRH